MLDEGGRQRVDLDDGIKESGVKGFWQRVALWTWEQLGLTCEDVGTKTHLNSASLGSA